MSPLRCFVVDDEPLAVKMLENFIARTPFLELAASYTDPVQALSDIRVKAPQLVFLDIQMPDLSGMELSRMVPADTRIIFTTAFKQYAFESYEVSALDFLLKPIRYQKFLEAAEKAREWFSMKEAAEAPVSVSVPAPEKTAVFIKVDGALRKVDLADILYVEGMKDYVMFYIEGQKRPLVTHLTMKSVEDMLPESQFMRVHRSYIVALDRIRSVDRNDCLYIGEEIIRVTEAYHDKFIQYLNSKFPGYKQ